MFVIFGVDDVHYVHDASWCNIFEGHTCMKKYPDIMGIHVFSHMFMCSYEYLIKIIDNVFGYFL